MAEGARLLQRLGVIDELHRGLGRLALDAEAAELVDGLRRQAEVADNRDAGLDDTPDRLRGALASFELHGLAAALLGRGGPRSAGLRRWLTWYDMNGMSAITMARDEPRTTAFT